MGVKEEKGMKESWPSVLTGSHLQPIKVMDKPCLQALPKGLLNRPL